MKQALLIVDIQNDYFSGGRMELTDMEKAALNAQQILNNCRNKALPIFHIQHLSQRPKVNFFIPNTFGAEIHPLVKPSEGETIITKHYPNSFRETSLHEKLQQKEVNHLLVCGAMSHMCVDSTVRAAYDLSYICTVISDACATKDLFLQDEHISARHVHFGFMAAIHGIFAEVISLQQYLTGGDRHANS